jgi:purine nucleosidase
MSTHTAPTDAAPTDTAPVYLDCDTGIDDSMTIAYLVAKRTNLVGIGTVSGNIGSEAAARNTLDLLELLGAPEIPVAVGAHDFMTQAFHGGAPEVHGHNGVGEVELPTSPRKPLDITAPELLSRLARQYPGELRVLAIGPLTNLGVALTNDPELAGLVRDVTIMGGAAAAPGNVTAVAEANIINDPEAAAIVARASWDLTMVPLDVTMEQRITAAQSAALRAEGTPALTALADMLEYYFDFYVERLGGRMAALHDPLAAAVMLDTVTLASGPRVPVEVDDTQGPGRGQTIVDRRGCYRGYPDQDPSDVRVALQIDDDFAGELTDSLLAAFGAEGRKGD